MEVDILDQDLSNYFQLMGIVKKLSFWCIIDWSSLFAGKKSLEMNPKHWSAN